MAEMRNGVVIVGAGHAGVQAAASLREEGFSDPVVLLGDENELPYHKPPLSKTFIKDAEAKPQPLRGEAFYTGNAIDFRPGLRVAGIDVPGRRLGLADGGAAQGAGQHLSRARPGRSGTKLVRAGGDAPRHDPAHLCT